VIQGNQNAVRLWETLTSNYSTTHRPISEQTPHEST